MSCTGRFGKSDWALAVTLIAVDERSVPAMSVLRSKRTGRHRTATVTRSIILRPSLFRATFLWPVVVDWVTRWALFHEVLDRQACCVERSSDLRRLASQKLRGHRCGESCTTATTEFRRPVE